MTSVNAEQELIRDMETETESATRKKLDAIIKFIDSYGKKITETKFSAEEQEQVKDLCRTLKGFIQGENKYSIRVDQVRGLNEQITSQIKVVYEESDGEQNATKEQKNTKESDKVTFDEFLYIRCPFGKRTTLELWKTSGINLFMAKLIINNPLDLIL